MWDDAGSTYLDRIYVDVAAAAAEFHSGDTVSARAAAGPAQAVAKQAGDGIARSLVAHATAALLGHLDDAGFERVEVGWRRVISGSPTDPASRPAWRRTVAQTLDRAARPRDRAGAVGRDGPVTRYPTGLIVGRFDPPHLGHSYMIESAAARSAISWWCSSTVRPGATRRPGSCEQRGSPSCIPTVIVIEVRHRLATDFDDPELWDEVDGAVPRALAARRRPPRRVLVRRLRRASWPTDSAPTRSSSTRIGRRCRSAPPRSARRRPSISTASRRPSGPGSRPTGSDRVAPETRTMEQASRIGATPAPSTEFELRGSEITCWAAW